MAGENPYIQIATAKKATQKFKILYRSKEGEVVAEVDPDKIPYEDEGLPGSLLEIGLGHGMEIDHACGGVAACSTCHVHVVEGLESCNEISDAEEDQLDYATDFKTCSRLACQCVPDGTTDLIVEIPSWNRNLAKEKHG